MSMKHMTAEQQFLRIFIDNQTSYIWNRYKTGPYNIMFAANFHLQIARELDILVSTSYEIDK